MPYHNEVEERIRFEIRKKIDTGDYKLIVDPNPKTLIARVFSLIEDNANGKTINGYVSCTNCNILLKSNGKRGTDLRLHLCYRSQKNIEERSNFPNISGKDGATKSHDTIKRKVLSGSKLRMERKKQLEQRRIEVINNLITSEYKLTKLNNRNDMWSVFAAITKQDGTPVKEYLYCSKCRAILKCDGCKTRIFKQHPCLGQMFGKAKGGPTSKTKSMMEREETTSTTSMDTSSDEDVYESRVKKRRKDKLDFIHDSQSTMQYEVEGSSSYSMCIKEEYNYNELSDESLAMARNEMNDYHNRIKNSDVPMETIEYVIYEIDPLTHIYNTKEAVSIKEEIKDPIWIKEELNSSADQM